jgi:hypothetical protein
MVMLYQQIQIPEAVYAIELKFRMRVSNLRKGKQSWFDARIMMDFKDAEGRSSKARLRSNTGKDTEGWVERSVKFLVPDGARTLDFMPALFQVESGTFDLDDVVLIPTDPMPLREKAKADEAVKREKQSKDANARRAQASVTWRRTVPSYPMETLRPIKRSLSNGR